LRIFVYWQPFPFDSCGLEVLNFLAKLVIEEQRCGNIAVGKLAHRHDHQGTDAGQQEGLDSVQQEGKGL